MAALKRAVLLDTNLLLLAAVGSFDKTLIGRKRLDEYSSGDFDLLIRLIERYPNTLTTPHLLTELNNLAEQCVPVRRHGDFRVFLAGFIAKLDEQWAPASQICATKAFMRLGLADAAVCHLANNQTTVITTDGMMHRFLLREKVDAHHFHYIRKSWNLT
jgi:hypothetical protein